MARTSSRQRLIQAALGLFAAQGITETTTKQIAEKAEVNEATLFRQFGNKNGLLLAVLEEGDIFQQLSQALIREVDQQESGTFEQVLLDYATIFLRSLDQIPELARSLIGESGRYPAENRAALGQGFKQANQYVAYYFTVVLARGTSHDDVNPADIFADGSNLSSQDVASLLHSGLLGYAVLELTSAEHPLWPNREVFLEQLVSQVCSSAELFSDGKTMAPAPNEDAGVLVQVSPAQASPAIVADLPATLVHEVLLRAKKRNLQDYAILYTLFAAGITPQELIKLERIHHVSDRDQHMLQVVPANPSQGTSRQVPINQWIMGKRYGSYQKNPLTQWLKSRKDESNALFLSGVSGVSGVSGELKNEPMPIVLVDIETLWQEVTSDLMTLTGRLANGEAAQTLHLSQIQQTWCVDLLMRGVSPDNMQILTGWTLEQLTPYSQRAKEKAAIEQVMQLDKKS